MRKHHLRHRRRASDWSSWCRAALTAVRDFNCFSPDNDPLKSINFGVQMVAGERLIGKIDHYGRNRRHGSPHAADPAVKTWVLTIMMAYEY
ncbi:DUF3768 domain-containing protein [Sphingomonas sp. R86521]|uniref:DUF3768 domain-containing protein n=1 Tax=Sphingomonas sp. R86521 TaxID=3093860 RepID=UPI0036D250F7